MISNLNISNSMKKVLRLESVLLLNMGRLANNLREVHITQIGFNRLKSVARIKLTEYVNDIFTLVKPFCDYRIPLFVCSELTFFNNPAEYFPFYIFNGL